MADEVATETPPTEPVEETKEDAEDIGDLSDDEPPPEEEAAEEEKIEKPYDEDPVEEPEEEGPPDFSIYKTNVAERLWRAKEAAKLMEVTASPDLVKRTKEYQEWRKKMDLLNRYVEEYSAAMKDLSEKRHQVCMRLGRQRCMNFL